MRAHHRAGHRSLALLGLTLGCGSLLGVDDVRFEDQSGGAAASAGAAGMPNAGSAGSSAAAGSADSSVAGGFAGSSAAGGSAGSGGSGDAAAGAAGVPGSAGVAGSDAECAAGDPCQTTCTQVGSFCSSCESRPCGGIPWNSGEVPFSIVEATSNASFSQLDLNAIHAAIDAWQGPAYLFDCKMTSCAARSLMIRPASTPDFGVPSAEGVQELSLVPGEPAYRYAHDLGHALGFVDTINRADRNQDPRAAGYQKLCADAGQVLWMCSAPDPLDPSAPRIATGQFGPYPRDSIMDPSAHENCQSPAGYREGPSSSDLASGPELTYSGYWAPFTPIVIGQAPSTAVLVSGVSLVGSPALCESDRLLHLFARGSDNALYGTEQRFAGGSFVDWAPWVQIASSPAVATEPACTVRANGRLVLATTDEQKQVWLREQGPSGWFAPTPIGSPVGGAGAPALTTHSPGGGEVLDVFVRDANNRLAWYAMDKTGTGAWAAPVSSVTLQGKPSASDRNLGSVTLAVHRSDDTLALIRVGGTAPVTTFINQMFLEDPSIVRADADSFSVFVARLDHRLGQWLIDAAGSASYYVLGGQVLGSPTVSASSTRVDIVARWRGSDALWWKFSPYTYPCYVEGEICGTCAR